MTAPSPTQPPISDVVLRLTPAQYRDKVLGGWLGKNAGSTLGTPFEGRTEAMGLTFYDPIPLQPAANDDLDLELLWLHALEVHGIGLTSLDLAAEWLEHMRYPWDEYGYATFNLRRGINPPLSGLHGNWFRDSMGATIRAEIWAMVAPGSPDVAARLAYQDAVLDHAEEGVWALMFLASLESAAFFVQDADRLIDIGLARIPPECRIARAIGAARSARLAGKSALEARSAVLGEVGVSNVTDTAQNLGFIALGLLYGAADFGASVCAAVNCGYDTDTTGATVGAILGLCSGAAALPVRWLEPIGQSVVVGWGVEGLPSPATVEELTDRTVAVGLRMVADRCPHVAIGEPGPEPTATREAPEAETASAAGGPSEEPEVKLVVVEPDWLNASQSADCLTRSSTVSVHHHAGLEVALDFGAQGPAFAPGVARSFVVELRNLSDSVYSGNVELSVPAGWKAAVPGAQGPRVRLEPGKRARLGYVLKSPAGLPPGRPAPISLLLTPEQGEPTALGVPLQPVACWHVVGPLKNAHGGGFEQGFPVESKPGLSETYLGRDDGLVGWQPIAFATTIMDIESIFGGTAGVAYCKTALRVATATDIKLVVHTNDGVRVWLNDRLVYQVHDHTPLRPSLCSGPGADVHLQAGENRLLVKVVRCDEPAELAMSFLDPEGRPVADLGNAQW